MWPVAIENSKIFLSSSLIFPGLDVKGRGIYLRRNRISHCRHCEPGEDQHRDSHGLPMVPALTLSVIGDASNRYYPQNAERYVPRRLFRPEQSERLYLHVSTMLSYP